MLQLSMVEFARSLSMLADRAYPAEQHRDVLQSHGIQSALFLMKEGQTESSRDGQNNNLLEAIQQPELHQSTRIRWQPERYGFVVSFPDSDPFLD